jgi:hypothetical protein
MDVFPSTISALPFWSKDPSLYPRAEMKTQGVVLNQNLHNFNEIYWKLGSKKWMECIDGVYHPHGAEVFDRGLHGKTTEPGFLKSMQNLFSFLTEHQNQKLSADFYLQCHRIACSHFKGESNGTLMGQEKIGVFRELTDTISASFAAPNYEIDNQGFSDFSDISGKLSLAFGSSFRLGDMIVVSASPLTINIVYQPMRQEQIELIFNFFLTEFYYDIGHAETEDAKLEAIAKLVQHLEWLHPPRDGCGRTDTAILNALLTTYGFTPVLLKYPYVSSCKGLKSWVKALKIGMRDWAQANSAQ